MLDNEIGRNKIIHKSSSGGKEMSGTSTKTCYISGSGSGWSAQNSLVAQKGAIQKYLDYEEVVDLTYYISLSIVLHYVKEWTERISQFVGRGIQEGVLGLVHVLQLIGFADMVNQVLKGKMEGNGGGA